VTCLGGKCNLPDESIWPEISWKDDKIRLKCVLLRRWELKGAFIWKEIGLEGTLSERWGLKYVLKRRR
jgi:hypothetical protein